MKYRIIGHLRRFFQRGLSQKSIYNIKVRFPYIDQNLYIGTEMTDIIIEKISSAKYDKIVAIVDSKLYEKRKDYLDPIFNKLKTAGLIFVDSKESNKNFTYCDGILSQLSKSGISRKSCLLAIGGGYVGDVVGFTSSIYMRGIDFVQIPTTLMSMSDAVMGKVAINNNGKKNLLGSFYSPRFTFCDVSLLEISNKRDIVFGLVEIWKHTLLENNLGVEHKISEYLNGGELNSEKSLSELIKFSLNAKKKYVENDYDDTKGLHKSLSLGHTFANYIESKTEIPHGPAVFYGLILVFFISYKLKKISKSEFDRSMKVARLFEKEIRMLNEVQNHIDVNDALEKLKFDKINSGNTYSFVLLKRKGYFVCKSVDTEVLKESLNELKKLSFS
ncbi:MAG: 3-dehydroquinate synthase [Candidatus Parcubacteria bacterium]|nr:3-dehydroquinate synthase [Candidatus Parcubacteria bacterium]